MQTIIFGVFFLLRYVALRLSVKLYSEFLHAVTLGNDNFLVFACQALAAAYPFHFPNCHAEGSRMSIPVIYRCCRPNSVPERYSLTFSIVFAGLGEKMNSPETERLEQITPL